MVTDNGDRQVEFERAAAEAATLAAGVEASAGADKEGAASAGVTAESLPGETQPPSIPDEAKQKASEFVAEWVPFGVMAQVRGSHWAVSAEQVRELAPAWADVLDKYWPEWWKFSGPEARLLLILGLVVFSKIQIEREIKRRLGVQVDAAHAEKTDAPPKAAGPDLAPGAPSPGFPPPGGDVCAQHRLRDCPECGGAPEVL